MSSGIQGTITHGAKASIGTSAVQLSAVTTPLATSVCIKAIDSNTGTVFVGGADVTTATGFPLYRGDSVTIEAKRLAYVYVIGSAAYQEVRWIAN